jgi:hypothetical protein
MITSMRIYVPGAADAAAQIMTPARILQGLLTGHIYAKIMITVSDFARLYQEKVFIAYQ